MKFRQLKVAAAVATIVFASATTQAGVSKSLPYPTGTPSANEIADQVYFVNHFYSFSNMSIEKKGKAITVLINKAEGKKPTTITLERFLNNDYEEGNSVNAKDLAIFRSGKLRGTGMLITDFSDSAKSQSYAIWLPALRKIRRFAEPAHDDAWGGSDFTFGDVTLRKPEHETHELVGTETFNSCLGAMEIADSDKNKYMRKLPEGDCSSKGKEVYVLKSTPKKADWWYDYRVSYVDTTTFSDMRTEYFKGGNKIKVLDRSWISAGESDPRGSYWGYWYAKNLETNHETWAVIPPKATNWNAKKKSSLWTERTLRKIKR